MICNACGTLLNDDSKFCNNCGASVGSSELRDKAELDIEFGEKKAQASLTKDEAEKLIQKLAEAGVTIEVKYAATQDIPNPPSASENSYTVFLHATGRNKIEVLKIVREVTQVPLSNAKNLIEVAPTIIKEGLSKREAETICQRLVAAGAIAEVEPSARGIRLPPISAISPSLSSSPAKPTNSMTSGCVALLLIIFLIFLCVALGQNKH